MYAKILIPSDEAGIPGTPGVYVTTPSGSIVAAQLLARGDWHPFRGEIARVEGEVHITPDSLTITVDGQLVLSDDANPLSPPGWWEAVDRVQNHVMVLLLPAGTPFTQPALGDALDALAGARSTAQAILPVTH